VSLDQGLGPDRERSIAEVLVDESFRTAKKQLILREDADLVARAMAVLSAQERTVVRYRFGLEGGRGMTLKEIGALMNISRERVRQIEVRAKRRLRKVFDEHRAIKSPPRQPRRERSSPPA
jgi:RNA polymerase sigma factor (sigma-70 family)